MLIPPLSGNGKFIGIAENIFKCLLILVFVLEDNMNDLSQQVGILFEILPGNICDVDVKPGHNASVQGKMCIRDRDNARHG